MTFDLQEVRSGQPVRADDYNRLVRHVRANTISGTIGILMERTATGVVLRAPRSQSQPSQAPAETTYSVFELSIRSVTEEGSEAVSTIVSVFVPEKVAPFVRTAFNSEYAPSDTEFFVSEEYERSGDWLDLGELSGDIFAWLDPEDGAVKFTDDMADISEGAVSVRIGEIAAEGESLTAVNSFVGIFAFAFPPDSVVPLPYDKAKRSIGFTEDGALQIHGFDGSSEGQMITVEETEGLGGADGTVIADGKCEKFDIMVRSESADGQTVVTKYISKDTFAKIMGAHEVRIKDADDTERTIYVFHKKVEGEEGEEGSGGERDDLCGTDPFPGEGDTGGGEDYVFPEDGQEKFPGKSEKCW